MATTTEIDQAVDDVMELIADRADPARMTPAEVLDFYGQLHGRIDAAYRGCHVARGCCGSPPPLPPPPPPSSLHHQLT